MSATAVLGGAHLFRKAISGELRRSGAEEPRQWRADAPEDARRHGHSNTRDNTRYSRSDAVESTPPLPARALGPDIPKDGSGPLHIPFALSWEEPCHAGHLGEEQREPPVGSAPAWSGRRPLREDDMIGRGRLITVLIVLAFAAYLLWST